MNGMDLGPGKKESDRGVRAQPAGQDPGQHEAGAERDRVELREPPLLWTSPKPRRGVAPQKEATDCAPIFNTDTQMQRTLY